MKIRLEHGGTILEYEHRPMPEGRFRALCSLALAAIVGSVFLGAIALVGVWAVVWAVCALTLYGVYWLIRRGLELMQ